VRFIGCRRAAIKLNGALRCSGRHANNSKCQRVDSKQGAAMPKAYIVTTYRSISNPDALAEYAKLAGPAMIAAGGRFLARGNAVKAYEKGVIHSGCWAMPLSATFASSKGWRNRRHLRSRLCGP
jgi:Domain of unknown function (DUF1330)